jgi:COP9 signalosome complex subunit 6
MTEVHVHPTVVMAMADHYTRTNLQDKSEKVIGCVLGQRTGRILSALESFEVSFKKTKEGLAIDSKGMENDLKLFQEAYPLYDFVGWYTTGSRLMPDDTNIQKAMEKYCPAPLTILLNPICEKDQRDLPMKVFLSLQEVPFKVTSNEAEAVVTIHCSKYVNQDDQNNPAVVNHYTGMISAIRHLHVRLEVVIRFLEEVKSGKVNPSPALLRKVKALVNRQPTMDSSGFKTDFLAEYNDGLLLSYLSAITKGCALSNDTMEKFNLANSGRGMRGMGMMGMGMMGLGNMPMGMLGMIGF